MTLVVTAKINNEHLFKQDDAPLRIQLALNGGAMLWFSIFLYDVSDDLL